VGDHEEVVLVVFDFGERARRDAVLDGERVKIKNAFEDEFDFFVGGLIKVDPENETLVAVDEAQRLELEVAADELALAKDERMDHERLSLNGGAREQAFFGGGDGGDEFLGRGGGEEGGAVDLVFEQFAEGAHDGEVVGGIRLGRAEHEDEADLFIGALAAADEVITATDGEGDGFDVLGARVGQRHGVADARGLEAIAGEEFAVKTVEVRHGGMISEQLGDLVERSGALGAFDIERDARRGEERGNFTSHTSNRNE